MSFEAAADQSVPLTTNGNAVPISLYGDGTLWTEGVTFALSGVMQTTIQTQTVNSDTSATLLINTGAFFGTLNITDGTTTTTIPISGSLGAEELAEYLEELSTVPTEPPQPTFNGLPIFGDQPSFSAAPMGGPATSVDTFLSLTPGTTQYGFSAGSHGWGITGAFITTSPDACNTAAAALAAQAGITSTLQLPSNNGPIATLNWARHNNCSLQLSELVTNPAGPTSIAGGNYSLTYNALFRQTTDN
jgi:hypothetical protein